ncbi:hypothetical protein RCL1_005206 [Eukaryota sp. TZLM3-RCL]
MSNANYLDMARQFLKSGQSAEVSRDFVTAIQHYRDAVSCYHRCAASSDPAFRQKYNEYADRILNEIKRLSTPNISPSNSPQRQTSNSDRYTSYEIEVLRVASKVKTVEKTITFLPWTEQDALDFPQNSQTFLDLDGLFSLNKKQLNYFERFERLSVLVPSFAQSNSSFSPFSITQSVVSNCSFIASLIVCANYESIYGSSLISKLIYPQNNSGLIISKSGKYIAKLRFNGCNRKVVIDDFLPYSSTTKPSILTAYSKNRHVLLVPLLEKAYLKLNGMSYDFNGSLSSYDLLTLIGWTPEVIDIKSQGNSFDWSRFFDGFGLGVCLATCSSSIITNLDLQSFKIQNNHAFAVIRVEKVENTTMITIIDPHGKGGSCDDGQLTLSFNDFCRYFDRLYISWNTNQLFSFKITNHFAILPKTSTTIGSIADCPQYLLKFSAQSIKNFHDKFWILLERHKFPDNSDNQFFAVHVKRCMESTVLDYTSRQFNLDSRKFEIFGEYSNSFHVLHKVSHQSSTDFIITIDERLKTTLSSYTITIFSCIPCQIDPLPHFTKLPNSKIHSLVWGENSAGGNRSNFNSFVSNPQISLFVKTAGLFIIGIECFVLDYCVGFSLLQSGGKNRIYQESHVKSVIYEPTFRTNSVFEQVYLSPGYYVLVPCTFDSNQFGEFDLFVFSKAGFEMERLQ